MERIDRRTLNLVPQTAAWQPGQVMRSKVRAYSHQGHGPRADHQAGYISATSDSTISLAKGSRSIHVGQIGSSRVPGLNGGCRMRKPAVGDGWGLLRQALSSPQRFRSLMLSPWGAACALSLLVL